MASFSIGRSCAFALALLLICSSVSAEDLAAAGQLHALASKTKVPLGKQDLSAFKRWTNDCQVLREEHLSSTTLDDIRLLLKFGGNDPDFQDACLTELEDRIGIDVDAHGFAFLSDEINTSRGKPQDYGAMQIIRGAKTVKPSLDRSVASSRNRIGIEPLDDFYRALDRQLSKGRPTTPPPLAMENYVAPTEAELRRELLALGRSDRDSQSTKVSDSERREIQHRNTLSIKNIVHNHGFPNVKEVGRGGVAAAFFLVQHSGDDPEFMNDCLKMLKPLMEEGDLPRVYYALLTDRVRILQGREQLYGTQGGADAKGYFIPTIEDVANVNQRRAEMLMAPLGKETLRKQRKPILKVSGRQNSRFPRSAGNFGHQDRMDPHE